MNYSIPMLSFATGLLLVCPPPSTAQQGTESPEILKGTRVAIMPGQTGPYARIASTDAKLLADAKWPRVTIAMRSVTGPEEIVYLTGYDSLATWQADGVLLKQSPNLRFSLEETSRKADVYASAVTTFALGYKSALSFVTPEWVRSNKEFWLPKQ